MKYPHSGIIIPMEKRKEINEKILYMIDSKKDFGITPAEIYQAYTGDGGLHGLSRSDFSSYHAYAEAKKEMEQGQFFTPPALCEFLVGIIQPGPHDLVADLTCGMGNFFNFVPVESHAFGCDLDMKAVKVAKYLYPEANIECTDIRLYDPGVKFDVIFGNPPFNLRWDYNNKRYLSQLFYCLRAHELLNPAGFLALVVPCSFLNDDFSDSGMIEMMNERFSYVLQLDLPADAFKVYGIEEYRTKIMVFQKRSDHLAAIPYSHKKLTVPAYDSAEANQIYEQYIRPLLEQKEKIRHKLLFEKNNQSLEDQQFTYKVKKLLFDIKRHPAISEQYAKCVDYVNRYYTQEKPKEMTVQEWEKKRLTKGKVLAYLLRVLRNQNAEHRDEIRLVKQNYGLKLKAYSPKTQAVLNKMKGKIHVSFNSMILDNEYPFDDQAYVGLFRRKRAEYERQSQAFDCMDRDREIDAYLDGFHLYDASRHEIIQLNAMQKHDLGLVMQKRWAVLNWQQGSGKTIAAIAWYKRLLDKKAVRNVFVVSTALAIHLTWELKLGHFGEDFTVIRSLKDINAIRPGQVVLVSLDRLQKYQCQVAKFVRILGRKVALVMDESDELTNPHALQTKAVLACFRKVPYKLLTTGTLTRNNITELYPQLELLYNNSIHMLCECEFMYEQSKDGEIRKVANPYYMKPFPAYGGYAHFNRCFNPDKVTVFGIKKHNQDILNSDSLSRLIRKTRITRKFEEVVGKKIYKHFTHRIEQNDAEIRVYEKIIREFHHMLHYFKSTGNDRKDNMLKIIRQIQLLIKSTSCAHLLDEYESNELPNKFDYIRSLVERFQEKVAIGTVFIEAAVEYHRFLQNEFPDRPVFLIKGDIPFKKRTQLIREFEMTRNGILISTQQSLKSSVNIPSCNFVIVESLQWNIPKLDQYCFRFVRYNSTEQKEIHLVTYNHTIEQNLLALLMAKERINEYIKTLDFKEDADIFIEFGIDLDVLNSLIEKKIDENGNIHLTWGTQRVS